MRSCSTSATTSSFCSDQAHQAAQKKRAAERPSTALEEAQPQGDEIVKFADSGWALVIREQDGKVCCWQRY